MLKIEMYGHINFENSLTYCCMLAAIVFVLHLFDGAFFFFFFLTGSKEACSPEQCNYPLDQQQQERQAL